MVLLDPVAARSVQSWLGDPRGPGLLDLYHSLAYHRHGLWGDDATTPRSVLLVRERTGRLEAFGAGEPEPAISWLARKTGRNVALLAPPEWRVAVERRVGPVERVEMVSLSVEAADLTPSSSAAVVRRITPEDSAAFLTPDVIPDWALASWLTFEALIAHGAGYVVPFSAGHAALAWVYSQAGPYDAIGVSTALRFRRLGLGRAAASALVSEILQKRGKVPVWTTAAQNDASLALAASLGFSVVGTETFLRWRVPS